MAGLFDDLIPSDTTPPPAGGMFDDLVPSPDRPRPTTALQNIRNTFAETGTSYQGMWSGLKADLATKLHDVDVNKYLHPLDSYASRSARLRRELKQNPNDPELRGTMELFGVNPDELLSDDFRTSFAAQGVLLDRLRAIGMANDDFLQTALSQVRESSEALGESRSEFDTWSGKGLTKDILRGGLDMIPAIVSTYVTKKPAIGGGVMGGQVYAHAVGEGLAEHEMEGRDARLRAMLHGLAEFIPETKAISEIFKPGANFISRAFRAAGAEALQEGITEILQTAIDAEGAGPDGVQMRWEDDMTWGQLLENVLHSATVGAGVGAGLSPLSRPGRVDTGQAKKVRDEIRDTAASFSDEPVDNLGTFNEDGSVDFEKPESSAPVEVQPFLEDEPTLEELLADTVKQQDLVESRALQPQVQGNREERRARRETPAMREDIINMTHEQIMSQPTTAEQKDTSLDDELRRLEEGPAEHRELKDFIADLGGISIEAGQQNGLYDLNQQQGFRWLFTKNGMEVGKARELAQEAGFPFETDNEFVEAMRLSVNETNLSYTPTGVEYQGVVEHKQNIKDQFDQFESGEFLALEPMEDYAPAKDMSVQEQQVTGVAIRAVEAGMPIEEAEQIIDSYSERDDDFGAYIEFERLMQDETTTEQAAEEDQGQAVQPAESQDSVEGSESAATKPESEDSAEIEQSSFPDFEADELAASKDRKLTAPPAAPVVVDIQDARDKAADHNKQVENSYVERNFSDEGVAEFRALGSRRRRDAWLDDHLTNEQENEIQELYNPDEEKLAEFAEYVGQFDDSSPEAMGRSIALWFKDVDKPNFKETPQYAGIVSALEFAESEGWDVDTVMAGATSRIKEWAGSDAAELFPRFFKKEAPISEKLDTPGLLDRPVPDDRADLMAELEALVPTEDFYEFGDSKDAMSIEDIKEWIIRYGDNNVIALPDGDERVEREDANVKRLENLIVNHIEAEIARIDPTGSLVIKEVETTDTAILAAKVKVRSTDRTSGTTDDALEAVDNGNIRERIIGTREIVPYVADIDAAAHEAATSPENDLPEPSEAQIEAGNYQKGHITVQGLDISIENPVGSTRKGIGADGPWAQVMKNGHYGYIKRTEGADGDHVDTFVGPNSASEEVFVVDQVNLDGSFDEAKVMIGFNSVDEAEKAYLSNYEEGWQGLGVIEPVSMDEFKGWLNDGDTKIPFSARASRDEVSPRVPSVASDEGALPEPQEQGVQELRRERDQDSLIVDDQLQDVPGGYWEKAGERFNIREGGQQRGLRAGERDLGDTDAAEQEPAQQQVDRISGQEDADGRLVEGDRDTARDIEAEAVRLQVGSREGADRTREPEISEEELEVDPEVKSAEEVTIRERVEDEHGNPAVLVRNGAEALIEVESRIQKMRELTVCLMAGG